MAAAMPTEAECGLDFIPTTFTVYREQRPARELARLTHVPGGVKWPDMNVTLRQNVVRTYGELARPFQLELLAKLNLDPSNNFIAPHDENVLVRTPHDTGSTTAILIHLFQVIIRVHATLGPRDKYHPTLAIMVFDTWEASNVAVAYARELAVGTGIAIGHWHGTPARRGTGRADTDANHILITTAGMFHKKLARTQINISKLRVVAIDNSNRTLGDKGKLQQVRDAKNRPIMDAFGRPQVERVFNRHIKDGILAAINQAKANRLDVQVVVNANRDSPSREIVEDTRLLLGLGPSDPPRELVAAIPLVSNRQKFVYYTSSGAEEAKAANFEALAERTMVFISNEFFAVRSDSDRLLISVNTRALVDDLYDAFITFLTANCTKAQAVAKVGKYHGGTLDECGPGQEVQERGNAGLDAFADPKSQMVVMIATPAVGRIILQTATHLLVAKVPDSIYVYGGAARAQLMDAIVGRDGTPCDVTIFLDTRTDNHIQEEMHALYELQNVQPPPSLMNIRVATEVPTVQE